MPFYAKSAGHVTRPYQGISLPKSKYPGYEVVVPQRVKSSTLCCLATDLRHSLPNKVSISIKPFSKTTNNKVRLHNISPPCTTHRALKGGFYSHFPAQILTKSHCPTAQIPSSLCLSCSNLNPIPIFYCFFVDESQSQCMKSHFPSQKMGKSQFPFYPFRTLYAECVFKPTFEKVQFYTSFSFQFS